MVTLAGKTQTSAQINGPQIALSPSSIAASTGSVFEAGITVSATGSLPIDSARLFLVFDPKFIRIVDGGHSSGPLIPGPAIANTSGYTFQSKGDNTTGKIDFSAVTSITGNAVATPFVLATIRFQALAETPPEGTAVDFSTIPPRASHLVVMLGRRVPLPAPQGIIVHVGGSTGRRSNPFGYRSCDSANTASRANSRWQVAPGN